VLRRGQARWHILQAWHNTTLTLAPPVTSSTRSRPSMTMFPLRPPAPRESDNPCLWLWDAKIRHSHRRQGSQGRIAACILYTRHPPSTHLRLGTSTQPQWTHALRRKGTTFCTCADEKQRLSGNTPDDLSRFRPYHE
jgi:hypothetical protein